LFLASDDALLKLLLEEHQVADRPIAEALEDEIVDSIFYDSSDLYAEALVIDLDPEDAVCILFDILDFFPTSVFISLKIVHHFFLSSNTKKNKKKVISRCALMTRRAKAPRQESD
jgi:hypothetical protein